MAVPAQVREAAAEADRQLQELIGAAPQPAPAANDAPPAPSANDVPPAPAANEVPPAPAPSAPAPAPTVTPTNLETELQRLQQQLRTESGRSAAKDAEVAELRGRLDALQQVVKAQPAAPAAPAAPPPSLITDEDRKDFGDDMIDFVQRVLRQTYGGEINRMNSRLSQLEGNLRKVQQSADGAEKSAQQLAHEKYIGQLNAAVPGWMQTNEDPAFVAWLKNRDTFSRKSRHEMLADAHNEADADTVAEFFKAFWKETGAAPAAQPAAAPTAPPAQPAQSAPTVDPSTLVAPSPSSSPTPAANPRGGKIWTQAEIEATYDRRMKKQISAEEFAKLEQEIEAAVLQGRVQG